MTAQRWPLSWPEGWKRTTTRQPARFATRAKGDAGAFRPLRDISIADAVGRLDGELRRLGVIDGDWLMSSNVKVKYNGQPYSDRDAGPISDPGVAVYFRLLGKDLVLACDKWLRVADNIAAIAAHVEAMRGIDRYGVGSVEQAFMGYAALPAKGSTWRTTLGFAPDQTVTIPEIEQAFRARARTAHPDAAGGSHDAMASLTAAKAEGLHELKTHP